MKLMHIPQNNQKLYHNTYSYDFNNFIQSSKNRYPENYFERYVGQTYVLLLQNILSGTPHNDLYTFISRTNRKKVTPKTRKRDTL